MERKARPPDFLGGMRHKKEPNSKFKNPNTKNAITNMGAGCWFEFREVDFRFVDVRFWVGFWFLNDKII